MAIERVDLELVEDNPFQPRTGYSTKEVDELAYSIEENGMIHTPTARRLEGGKYQLAEGHMRLRAHRKLAKKDPKKWGQIPLEIKAMTDEQMAILSLEENLRRADLTPIETARAIEKYMTIIPDATETGLAKKINMSQGGISNMRRVLRCPEAVLEKIIDGRINFTMARELLIFSGLNAGFIGPAGYSRDDARDIKDEKFLMLEAVRGIRKDGSGYGGEPATVDGVKRSICSVCVQHFPHLEKGTGYGLSDRRSPLFDTRVKGCLKCSKMIKANQTKSGVLHFCTDRECWDKLQAEHIELQKAEAQKKMQEDIARRLVSSVEDPGEEGEDISEKYPETDPENIITPEEVDDFFDEGDDFLSEVTEEGEEQEQRKEAELPRFEKPEELCRGCINAKHCSRGGYGKQFSRDVDGYYCSVRTDKARYKELQEQAKAKMPRAFSELVTTAGGTRSEVLDLRVLRLSNYDREQLQSGYALLSGSSYAQEDGHGSRYDTMDLVQNPEECLESCTTGFHFAFDSSDTDPKVQHVCTRPRCLSGKKAALTREKNNAGNERKKAEAKAIKEAVTNTVVLDKPRMKLILAAQVGGKQTERNYYNINEKPHIQALLKLLGIDFKDDRSYGTEKPKKVRDAVAKAIDDLSEEALAKIVVEFMLSMLTYDGDIRKYTILTTEALKWLGVNIPNIEKKGSKKADK